MSQDFNSVADLALSGQPPAAPPQPPPVDTKGWTFTEPQKPANNAIAPSTAGWTFSVPEKPVLKPTVETPHEVPWWQRIIEEPKSAPVTFESILKGITGGVENISRPGAPGESMLHQAGRAGLGAMQVVGAPLGALGQELKYQVLGPDTTFGEALEKNFGLDPAIAKGAGDLLGLGADPANWLIGPAFKAVGNLRRATEVTARLPAVEERAANLSDIVAPGKGVLATRAQEAADTILGNVGHNPRPMPTPEVPITTAHIKPVTTPPGPLTEAILQKPFETLGNIIEDPLQRVALVEKDPSAVLGATLEVHPQRLEGIVGKVVGPGRGRIDLQDDTAIRQYLTQQSLKDERLEQFGTMGREYQGENFNQMFHHGEAGPAETAMSEALLPGKKVGTRAGDIPPIAGASVNDVKAGLSHVLFHDVDRIGLFGQVMSYGRKVTGAAGDLIRGTVIGGTNVVKGMGAEGQQLVQIMHRAFDDAGIRFGYISDAFKQVSKTATDEDWKAIQPHVDLSLKAEQQPLSRTSPIGSVPHPDVPSLPVLTPAQLVIKDAVTNYYGKTLQDIMKVTGQDYAAAQKELVSYLAEGAPHGKRLPPRTEFLNAAERIEQRLAFEEHLGKGGETAQNLLQQIKNKELAPGPTRLPGVFSKYDSTVAQTWYDKMTGSTYNTDKITSQIVNAWTNMTVAAKLPFAVLRHAGQSINTAAVADMHSLTQGLFKAFRLAESAGDQSFVEKIGMITQEGMSQLRRIETTTGFEGKGTGIESWGSNALEKSGLYRMRAVNIRIAALTGREMLNSAVLHLEKPENVQLLQEMGFDLKEIERIGTNGVAEMDQVRAGRWLAQKTQFGARAGDLPLMVQSNPMVRFMFLLKGFHFRQTQLLRDTVWKNGLQDIIKNKRITAQNLRPLLTFSTLAWPVGEAMKGSQILGTYLSGGALTEPNLFKYYEKRTPPELINRWIDRISFVGALGMVDAIRQEYMHPTRDPGRLVGTLFGGGMGDLTTAAAGVSKAGQEIKAGQFPTKGLGQIGQVASGYVPSVSFRGPYGVPISLGPGLELPQIIRKWLQNK